MNKTIEVTNKDAIADYLNKIQSRCNVGIISLYQVEDAIKWIENRFASFAKKYIKDCVITFAPKRSVSRGYDYQPEATHMEFKYNSRSQLVLVRIYRADARSKASNTDYSIRLTGEAESELIRKFESGFSI